MHDHYSLIIDCSGIVTQSYKNETELVLSSKIINYI